MSSRNELLLGSLPKSAAIIEIGPSLAPIAAKSDGWNTVCVDHDTREGLLAKYASEPAEALARIEEVDYVCGDGPLCEAIPAALHGTFDAFIASHVIEHTPDLIDFLGSAETLLNDDGIVILAVPDKRFCFDYFEQLTTTGQVLEAHLQRRTRHTPASVFDQEAYFTTSEGRIGWGQHPVGTLKLTQSLESAQALFDKAAGSTAYEDLHAWRFTPARFELILLELARLGKTDWRVERVTEARGIEFLAWLKRGGKARAAAMAEDELNDRRLELLRQSMVETKTQIDFWLEDTRPPLRKAWGRLTGKA